MSALPMIIFRRNFARLRFFALLLFAIALAVPASVVWAQFEDIGEEEEAAANQQANNGFEVSEETFYQWVYGSAGRTGRQRDWLDSMASLHIDSYDRACDLSPEQKNLLRLAAQGDIKRFEDEARIVKQKFDVARFDQQKFNQVWQEVQPLRNKIQKGLFGESSLLHKAVKRILDDEQVAKYEQVNLERRKSQYEAKIGLILAQLQYSIPMRDEQRAKFERMLLEETPTPNGFGQYTYYIVLINASKAPEEKLKAIFDDAQWKALKQTFAQVRGMERTLKKQGLLP